MGKSCFLLQPGRIRECDIAYGIAPRINTATRGADRLQSLIGVERVNVIFRLESSEDEVRQEIWLKILGLEAVV